MGTRRVLKVFLWPSHIQRPRRSVPEAHLSSFGFTTRAIASFKDFAGKAFTIFDAGLAETFCICPKIILSQALRAGLFLSLSMVMPGTTNLPAFFTSTVATSQRESITPLTSFFFSPVVVLIASYIPLAVILEPAALWDFMAFMAFMAFIAFIAAGAMSNERVQESWMVDIA